METATLNAYDAVWVDEEFCGALVGSIAENDTIAENDSRGCRV